MHFLISRLRSTFQELPTNFLLTFSPLLLKILKFHPYVEMLGLSYTNPIGCYHINMMIPIILYGYLHIFEFKYNLSEFRLFLLLVDDVEQIYFPLFRKSKL